MPDNEKVLVTKSNLTDVANKLRSFSPNKGGITPNDFDDVELAYSWGDATWGEGGGFTSCHSSLEYPLKLRRGNTEITGDDLSVFGVKLGSHFNIRPDDDRCSEKIIKTAPIYLSETVDWDYVNIKPIPEDITHLRSTLKPSTKYVYDTNYGVFYYSEELDNGDIFITIYNNNKIEKYQYPIPDWSHVQNNGVSVMCIGYNFILDSYFGIISVIYPGYNRYYRFDSSWETQELQNTGETSFFDSNNFSGYRPTCYYKDNNFYMLYQYAGTGYIVGLKFNADGINFNTFSASLTMEFTVADSFYVNHSLYCVNEPNQTIFEVVNLPWEGGGGRAEVRTAYIMTSEIDTHYFQASRWCFNNRWYLFTRRDSSSWTGSNMTIDIFEFNPDLEDNSWRIRYYGTAYQNEITAILQWGDNLLCSSNLAISRKGLAGQKDLFGTDNQYYWLGFNDPTITNNLEYLSHLNTVKKELPKVELTNGNYVTCNIYYKESDSYGSTWVGPDIARYGMIDLDMGNIILARSADIGTLPKRFTLLNTNNNYSWEPIQDSLFIQVMYAGTTYEYESLSKVPVNSELQTLLMSKPDSLSYEDVFVTSIDYEMYSIEEWLDILFKECDYNWRSDIDWENVGVTLLVSCSDSDLIYTYGNTGSGSGSVSGSGESENPEDYY